MIYKNLEIKRIGFSPVTGKVAFVSGKVVRKGG